MRQEYPESFSKEVYVLSAINDNTERQLERLLQQEREEHSEDRILLIPYFFENSRWIGVLIEFQETNRILRAEYIDPVNKANIVPDKLQYQFADVYPSVTLRSRNVVKTNDPTYSSALIIKYLLDALEIEKKSNFIVQQTCSKDYWTSITTDSQHSNEGKAHMLRELQQLLEYEQNRLGVKNLDILPQKIQKTAERIREYEEEERMDDAEKEMFYLTELRKLQNLVDEVTRSEHIPSVSQNNSQVELHRMEEDLQNSLAKLKIKDILTLPQKISRTEERIKDYEEEERIDDAEKERVLLKELQRLENLKKKIDQMNESPNSQDNLQSKIEKFEVEFRTGLEKTKVKDIQMLSQKILKTEERIKDYEEEERIDDAEKERVFLKEYHRLQNLWNEIDRLTKELSVAPDDTQMKLEKMTDELNNGLKTLRIKDVKLLPQKIMKTKERIEDFKDDQRMDDIEKETIILTELQRLQNLAVQIAEYSLSSHLESKSIPSESDIVDSNTDDSMNFANEQKQLLHIDELLDEIVSMPDCARKTVFELLIYFGRIVLKEDTNPKNQDLISSSFEKLKYQLKREEQVSDDVDTIVHNLTKFITSDQYQVIIHDLHVLLKALRLVNVSEIQRLIGKAKEAAELIKNKDIVLLIGPTGSGKSTTIQFLSGAKMQHVKVETTPGKYLDHVAMIGPIDNPDLKYVTTTPLQRSETRYIATVTIQLKDILGSHVTDTIVLCDAPGFEDTSGPEVDIANSIGVIDALKRTNSVKLLVLSSYLTLGDKGQGIQKLAHILVNMIRGIEDRLNSIVYAFTKYPDTKDINSLLVEIKRAHVDNDVTLSSDSAFVSVLTDMIDKTEDNTFKIEPTKDQPHKLLRTLKKTTHGIKNPGEVFSLSMSEKTRSVINDHIQKDRFSIICAMKHKDIDLVLFYLNDLEILKDLLNQGFVRTVYEESIRFINENISTYCSEIKEKFNRALISQDGLQKKDICDYHKCIEYLTNAQILKKHLDSTLLSPASMLQNIIIELNKLSISLQEEELNSPLIGVYLQNFFELKNTFSELEDSYNNTCQEFQNRLHQLIKTAREFILTNDFPKIAKTVLAIYQSICVLKNYLNNQIRESYHDTVKYFLQHLNSLSDDIEPFLVKLRLSNEEVEIIKKFTEILRSAKENATLQESISKSFVEKSDEYQVSEEKIQTLKDIYDQFIQKIIGHFNKISLRIKEIFDNSGDQALEHIKSLVNDMDSLRTIPELEAKTAEIYYKTIENIRIHMQKIQAETEKLITNMDQNINMTNFKSLAKSLVRLKNSEWINEASPGTFENLLERITEELVQIASQLQDSLRRLDFTLKYPENISLAIEIVKKIELMRDLEQSIPELKRFREEIVKRFTECAKASFERIQKTFSLEDKDVYRIKQNLRNLEEIKREYESLQPARVHLQKQGYADINMLNNEIKELIKKQNELGQKRENIKKNKESELNKFNTIIREYMNTRASQTGMVGNIVNAVKSKYSDKNLQANNPLSKFGYSNIDEIYKKISDVERSHQNNLQQLEDQNSEIIVALTNLRSINKEYESLLKIRHSSSDEINYLREKGFNDYEIFDDKIKEMTKVINERGNSKQTHHFIDQLNASVANNAMIYIIQCERADYDSVRENAIDVNENLRKYIREYGNFLKQEINRTFFEIRTISNEKNPLLYSQELEMHLRELSSFNKYSHVFQCINGDEIIEYWQQQFLSFHHILSAKMEEYKLEGKLRELKDQIIIAQALSCVDRFGVVIFAGNGFGSLYRQYQGEMNKESRVIYRTVLEYISKEDFANAANKLSEIDEDPWNVRDKAQIENDLQSSLNKLMRDTKSIAHWLDGKIEREDNRDQIIKIKENMDKIRTACNKNSIIRLLDEKTRENLQTFDDEINDILAGILFRGLSSIEAFMQADSFFEAEQGMERLSQIQRELTGYCVSKDVEKKGTQLRGRIDSIVTEILDRNDFSDVNKYSVDPPKDLLTQLKLVAAHGNARFTQAYTSIIGKIRQNFNLAIEDVRNAPLNERSARIHSLNYALHFLPDDLQIQFKQQIDGLSKLIANEVNAYKEDLDKLLINTDHSDHSIIEIGRKAAQYSKQNMRDLLRVLQEQCLKRLYIYQADIEKSFDEHKIEIPIDLVKKILMYEEHVGVYIPEIKGISENIRKLIKKNFLTCSVTLSNISTIEQTDIVVKAFLNLKTYLLFFNTLDKKVNEFFPNDIIENMNNSIEKMSTYLDENSQKFRTALEDKNVIDLHKTMLISNNWKVLLKHIKQCSVSHRVIENLLILLKNVISYEDMYSEFENLIEQLKKNICVEFITDETTRYETTRDELFNNIQYSMNILRSINQKFKDNDLIIIDIDILENEIRIKVDKIKNQLMSKASQSHLTTDDTDSFRTYYNHLISLNKHLKSSCIDIQQVLEDAKENVLKKVNVLYQELENNMKDIDIVANKLSQMKFYAENLSMFGKYVNDKIDNFLKFYQGKQGPTGIYCLSSELEKSEIGARMINEHSALSAKEVVQRRKNMQNQDNIDYMLNKLTGTDIDKEVLRSRYETFNSTYQKLIRMFLRTIQQNDTNEPDLEVLVTQTKSLVSSVNKKPGSFMWTESFKDDIPVLLAHIFAIWTLKNTQHYNTMRGIEDANSYLLRPHVGQVIAILRLLGLGYAKKSKLPILNVTYSKKIAEDLENNLVELGTGEGKSVVMAVTACVFALTDVDVNCSCYSDVLSTRDAKDFASVFVTLGIEKRIEYGTFNKLCEQLLNEQCNIRDKVRDMIVNNKSTIDAIDTKSRIRAKVLLIDEVDVFLSDKYYGGVYIPSVYLKDPSVKALLDAIWQNKTVRSLNAVKSLPAYKTCINKYTNWVFLFDEAIKDMLAALKSYKSSTYIVHNDKIAYVDGESIADNVVLGYDTVWTYYYENEKGNISKDSLDDNVGILINCGTFSYAEMPHEFVFIGGVTGTLKTLAKVEKKILENVYSITRKTYIPSVYGESNRKYNPSFDVQVVNESEYFMKIFGEIRTICDLHRSILVFFESEEKLTAFYRSEIFASMRKNVQIITEKVSVSDRELFVERASRADKVTLLTRMFGRGTDFICRNQKLLLDGGIHVLQTFFSEEKSEEYQIMGRGARQGEKGSYRMILLDSDLEWILGSTWKDDIVKIHHEKLHDNLDKIRTVLYESKAGAKGLGIKQCEADHKASKEFMSDLTSGKITEAKNFLAKRNQGANLVTAASRSVLLMDATGSMSSLLSAAKETVCTMFERASTVLSKNGLPDDAFQMQFVVYRDYDCKADGILQSSSWETKPSKLRDFMATITARGGGDYEEAIEIGLSHAVEQSEQSDGLSQVILIADAPTKDVSAINRDRQTNGGEAYWSKTKYKTPTHYLTELQKLKAKNIPIHAFYLHDGAEKNFREMSSATSGRCEKLNINSPQGAEMLTNFVTEEVLRKTAGSQGNEMVEYYRKIYVSHT
ncbi:unnamed protein product [Adineta steineri]|uniref:SecA family profile domain-containing protein n=1 Tax=Adineta steineri TaxID=433720 RepID=A0A814BXF4_9BILA|nr:unnamed protein product [Adineta steineri]CAF4017359.1 unnamed protein product [Adineta steineri]